MSKLPRVAGLILCKRMEVNPAAVEISLVGLFHTLAFSAWPAHAPFTVYAALQDGLWEGTMELFVMHLETEKRIYSYKKWFNSSDRSLTFNLEWRVRTCSFPAPGRYLVGLQLDKNDLAQHYLDVKAKEGAR